MKKDNSILTKLLDHLIGEAEGGECDEIDKWGSDDQTDKGDESDGNDTDIVNEDDLGEQDDDDENAKKLKKFMASIKD